MLLKCCIQYTSKFGKPRSHHRTGKDQFSFQSQKQCQRMFKLLHNLTHLTCSNFSKLGFNSMWTSFKLVLEKAKETEIKLPTSVGSSKKHESSRKTSTSALLTMPKPLTVWITINCGKFWKRWEYQTTWPASWETYMPVRKQQLELDMEKQTGSK